MSLGDKVAHLYPQALSSLFVAFYDSQGYGRGILTRLHFRSNHVLILMDSIVWKSTHMFDTSAHIFLSDYYRNCGINNSKCEQIEVRKGKDNVLPMFN
jgi:hypothetical protein